MRRTPIRVVSLAGILVAGLFALGTAGCGSGREQSPAPDSQGEKKVPVTAAEPSTTRGREASEARSDGPLNGINLTAYTTAGYGSPAARADITRIADLGATAITLTPTWYMTAGDSARIAPDPAKTPSDAGLIRAMGWIRDAGLQVILKPHVDVLDETFRGDIQPGDRARWFRSYRNFIDHYAAIASGQDAAVFVVGTELKSMSVDPAAWQKLISTVRSGFSGRLTYAANWDEYEQVPFWDDLDLIGIDAYFPLVEGNPDPGPAELRGAWTPIVDGLRAASERWGKPVLLTEAGYPSQVGATGHPWEVRPGEPVDQPLQARAYRAAFEAFAGEPWMVGINWWSWRADPSPDEDQSTDYTPEGKRAEVLLGREWASAPDG